MIRVGLRPCGCWGGCPCEKTEPLYPQTPPSWLPALTPPVPSGSGTIRSKHPGLQASRSAVLRSAPKLMEAPTRPCALTPSLILLLLPKHLQRVICPLLSATHCHPWSPGRARSLMRSPCFRVFITWGPSHPAALPRLWIRGLKKGDGQPWSQGLETQSQGQDVRGQVHLASSRRSSVEQPGKGQT